MTTTSTMITVAPTGAETAKADCPALPVTIEELVATARECEAAGAAMIHVHVRDDHAQPSLDLGRLQETVSALRESTSLVVQLSTGGSVHDSLESRLQVLTVAPDSCSLTCGSVNFGDEVFLNPFPFMRQLHRAAQEAQVVPEFELFDLGQVHALRRLLEIDGLPFGGRVHCDLVLGVPGAADGTVETMVAMVQALPESVTSWSATGIGRSHLPVMAAAVAMGGHVRVGMEDTLTFARGQQVASNSQLVSRAADLGRLMQRPPMSVEMARQMLGVADRV